jgi:hypothetical protein
MRFLSVLGFVIVLAMIMPGDLFLMVLGPLALGALTAVLMLFRGGHRASTEPPLSQPHSGPNMSRIPVQGFPGPRRDSVGVDARWIDERRGLS